MTDSNKFFFNPYVEYPLSGTVKARLSYSYGMYGIAKIRETMLKAIGFTEHNKGIVCEADGHPYRTIICCTGLQTTNVSSTKHMIDRLPGFNYAMR